jgi:hypothetical protein
MKRKVFILGILIMAIQFAHSQTTYISPGIGFSWDFNGHFILSPKISIGVLQNGIFYNITFGRSSSSMQKIYSHYFVEVQCGKLTAPSDWAKTQLFYGGGLGLTIPSGESEPGVSFRATLFTGYWAFLNATFLFKEKIYTEVGGQIVLPFPIASNEFGPVGG